MGEIRGTVGRSVVQSAPACSNAGIAELRHPTGIFSLVASVIIMPIAITMLKMDRAKAKWRLKLQKAFEGKREWPRFLTIFALLLSTAIQRPMQLPVQNGGSSSYCPLLPCCVRVRIYAYNGASTSSRTYGVGLEAVVFVGGVSLGESATAIPLAAIVGIICGLACGFLIYAFASRTTFTIFLIVMTNLLLLIGAGLFSKGVWSLQEHAFIKL
jgi:high-affinity iron transporter